MIKRALASGLFTLGLALFLVTPAQAVLVTTTVTGSVDLADASNPFGLTTADSVTAVAVYDDGGIPAVGAFNLPIDSNPSFSLTITLGSFTFVETDDDKFGTGFPRLAFLDGQLDGIDFERDGFPFGAFPDLIVGGFDGETRWFLDEFVSGGANNVLLEGTWDLANAVTVPNVVTDVPEPATWPLFAGALFGLAGFGGRARRKCLGA